MSNPASRTGDEKSIRAIVYKEGDFYIAQCLEYDICTQASGLPELMDRLYLTVEAEFATCKARGKNPCDVICQAPNYYHGLWEKRSVRLDRLTVATPEEKIEFALAA